MNSEYQEWKLRELLNSLGFIFADRGDELQLSNCPFCEKDRTTGSDHFSFSRESGQYKCVKCEAKGNYFTFRREMGADPFPAKEYRKIDQSRAKEYSEKLPAGYLRSYEEARKIPTSVLEKYGVGFCNHPKLGPCRVYQYWHNGEIVNLKYVNREKKMLTEYSAMPVYYGTQFLKTDIPCLFVTEGEDDCHVLVGQGFDNVVSIPYGAGSYSEEMGEVNKLFKKIYLLFDNDKSGQDGAKKFVQKAGFWKCWNVILPFKDARDCLKNGIGRTDFLKYIEKAKQFEFDPSVKYRPALSIEKSLDLYEIECRNNERGIKTSYDIIDEITGGLRGGDVFSIIANPGCFKTTVLFNLLSRSVFDMSNKIAIAFSFEMGTESTIERNIQSWTGNERLYHLRRQVKENSQEWQNMKANILENKSVCNLMITDEPSVSLEGIEKIMDRTEEVTGKQVALIGIDYLDFINESGDEYERVKKIMVGIKQLMKRKKCAAIIIGQTNRGVLDNDSEIGPRSAKGGTAIEATSDFMIGLWIHDDMVVGRFTKHRRVVGDIQRPNPYLNFHINKRSYTLDSIEYWQPPKKEEGKGRVK